MATKAVQAAEAVTRAVAEVPKALMFKKQLGNKQIFLPNFVLTMTRNRNLPPTFASFIVPLEFNKLDLRDYLWNGYGVHVLGVRSFIQLQKLRQGRPSDIRIRPRQWFRPRSIKKMTVEMERPFVWPAVPKDLEPWNQNQYRAGQEHQRKEEEGYQPGHREKPDTANRRAMKEQAKAILAAGGKPKPELDEWEDVGEPREVETDLDLNSPASDYGEKKS